MTTLGSGQSTGELAPLPFAEPTPPDDEDAWEELPGRPLRKKLGPFSIVLCACLLAGGFFYAGVRVEKSKVGASSGGGGSAASIIAALTARAGAGATPTTTAGGAAGGAATGRTGAGAAAAGGAGGAAAGAGAAGGFGGAAAGVRGTIVLIDGDNVYLRETDQTVVKVSTNAGTTISVTSTGTVANLHPGDTVRVTGPTGSDGTVAATSLTDTGAAAGGGGGGFGGGAGGGAGAGATGAAGATGGAGATGAAGAAGAGGGAATSGAAGGRGAGG